MKDSGMMKATSLETYTTATATNMGSDMLAQKLMLLCCGNIDSIDCCYFVETTEVRKSHNSPRTLIPGENLGSEKYRGNIGEA